MSPPYPQLRGLLSLIVTGPRRQGEPPHLCPKGVLGLPLVVAGAENLGVPGDQVPARPDAATLDLVDLQDSSARHLRDESRGDTPAISTDGLSADH